MLSEYSGPRWLALLHEMRTLRLGTNIYRIYYGFCRKAVEQGGLGGHLFVVVRQGELWPLTQQCDLFLRPTSSDGDAVSVREALSLGVPVVASDCVPRPPGAVTYRTGDVADLFNKVEEVLAAMSSYRRRIRQIDQGNASGPTVALVSWLLGTTPEDAV